MPAPIKNVDRALVKVMEKYRRDFSKLTDLSRATLECMTEAALLDVLKKLLELAKEGKIFIVRIKHRLDAAFEALEFGGYRDILINLAFSEDGHIVELQLNLSEFVRIKTKGGGHLAYGAARMLQAFEPDTSSFMGVLDESSSRDVGTGLLKKANFIGLQGESVLSAFSKPSAQLVEVSFSNVDFSVVGVKDLNWLGAAAGALRETLKILKIVQCTGLEGASLPTQLGELKRLVSLHLTKSKFGGGRLFVGLEPVESSPPSSHFFLQE